MAINTKTYTGGYRDKEHEVQFSGPAHSLTASDIIGFGRDLPKATSSSRGVFRPRVRTVQTVTCDDGVKRLVTFVTQAHIPVGAPDAAIDLIADDHADVLDVAGVRTFFKSTSFPTSL